jgi:small conductance mechanosensitive channel
MAIMNGQPEETWNILATKLAEWLRSVVQIVPNLVVALVVMIASVVFASFVAKIAKKLLHRVSQSETVNRLIVAVIKILFIVLGLFASLGILNLEKTVTSLLAGAGVIGLALGFAFQEIAANFFAGVLIAIRKPYKEGDIVQVDTFMGTVNQITLRTTNLTTFNGLEVLIPNKDMFTKAVTNFTSTPDRRVEINGGVGYGDDLRKAEKVAIEMARQIEGCIQDKPVEFFFTGFGDSSITFQLRFWVLYPKQNIFLKATHEAIIGLKKAFDQNGITFPFPIRTLELGNPELLKSLIEKTKHPQSDPVE